MLEGLFVYIYDVLGLEVIDNMMTEDDIDYILDFDWEK